jgi:MSHA biogenesis protein MshO
MNNSYKLQAIGFKARDIGSGNLKLEAWSLRLGARRRRALGVTLVEMVVVIAITGIIATVVAVFIRRPVEGYVDAARRAALTDIADTALRRITRDLRTAVPNSTRVTTAAGVSYIEFLETRGGGRYRAEMESGGGGNPLIFNKADATFDVIGPMPAELNAGYFIVVYNVTSDPTITEGNAYSGDNRANYSSSAGQTITLNPAFQFPFPSPGSRFQVVRGAVTYACNPATQELRRYWGYAINNTQLIATDLRFAGATAALLASDVTDCSFSYTTSGASQQTGVVTMMLQIEQAGERIRLFQQAHVSNVP